MSKVNSVDDFLRSSKYPEELRILRRIILSAGLDEHVKWGAPVYSYQGHNVIGMRGFKSYFALWFFQGSLLADKHKKLMNAQEGVTKALRQWRMTSAADIDKKVLLSYLREAIENEKRDKRVAPKKPTSKTPSLPPELANALASSKRLQGAFSKLTPGRQKDYAEYIAEAKREETRATRLKKIMPMILSGLGLNDKYI